MLPKLYLSNEYLRKTTKNLLIWTTYKCCYDRFLPVIFCTTICLLFLRRKYRKIQLFVFCFNAGNLIFSWWYFSCFYCWRYFVLCCFFLLLFKINKFLVIPNKITTLSTVDMLLLNDAAVIYTWNIASTHHLLDFKNFFLDQQLNCNFLLFYLNIA